MYCEMLEHCLKMSYTIKIDKKCLKVLFVKDPFVLLLSPMKFLQTLFHKQLLLCVYVLTARFTSTFL